MAEEVEKDDLVVVEKGSSNFDQRLAACRTRDLIDSKYGYVKYTDAEPVNAWLVNVQPSEAYDSQNKTFYAAADFYFLGENGNRLKISYPFRPYLYLGTTHGYELQVAAFLSRKYPLTQIEVVEKENLDLKNHLSGLKSKFVFISFASTVEHAAFKKDMFPQIRKNQENLKSATAYTAMLAQHLGSDKPNANGAAGTEAFEHIIDIREYDLPYHMRVAIDERIFVGLWYTVVGHDPQTLRPSIKVNKDLLDPPDPVVCAFDIETTKAPLKFPDSSIDSIMMISYMIDGEGFLIINREIVSEDITDFEYTPKPEFKGEFRVFNEKDEKALIRKFFDHLLKVKPHIMVTYNGDFFDWPFVEARAKEHGINMEAEIGFVKDAQDEYKHINSVHMDAFRWVKRDSYLPVGSQNLKATTKAKLRFDPCEVDPEEMVDMAKHQPQTLASYSVSDAVSTYYLYMKYVHPFIFALCTIIPLGPDDVLRKGSGTLCEALLMVEAFHKSIIFPNKQIADTHKMAKNGHLIESETYVGGHVEALESGVFRADIPCRFRVDPEAIEMLQSEVAETLKHTLKAEMGVDLDTLEDFDEVVNKVVADLEVLRENPMRHENPKIYHLDVGAMYPNIILTNRLQPPAIVKEEDCMACVYNTPDAVCRRQMDWVWRGELIPANRHEYVALMQQLEQERFGKPPRPFHTLPKEERLAIEKKRVQDYCRKVYSKVHVTKVEQRTSIICERENGFYVNTVRAFRDRRYDYKAMLKKAKNALSAAPPDDITAIKSGQARVVLFESLQLAHKCILNSFYGYVMRKGSRWFSMEMAGIVCHTGANIITAARELVERIGRPLELDTDGIWCLLPESFPEDYSIKLNNGKSVKVSYPGAMLNAIVKDKFTNDQYHTLKEDGTYEISSENSIFFEVDGPYLAMILPASKEEGKKLKKRYAVFNYDGSLAELKGFEVKRRGELNIIKEFQKDVFKAFLGGTNLQEAYECVAKVADNWLDILFSKGADLRDEELFDLISENRSMSRKLEDYGSQKSTSITTAKRLAAFLGPEMTKDAGLACRYIISRMPTGAPVTERALPLAIFKTHQEKAAEWLTRWTKSDVKPDNINIRELLDWPYYIERLGSCIQKIVTIPAALQGISNPVPRVAHPDWLERLRRQKIESANQPKITDLFKKLAPPGGACPSTPKSTRSTPGRKRPMPAVFVEDLRDNEILEVDEAGNPIKRQRAGSMSQDMDGLPATPSRLGGLSQRRKQLTASQATPKSAQAAEVAAAPEIPRKTWKQHGFNEWLSYMKKKWARMRDDRRQQKRNALKNAASQNVMSTMLSSNTSNLDQLVAYNRHRMANEFWHLLQVSETRIPGVFDVFALVDGCLKRFSLDVPRLIYINDIHERPSGRRVQKILPKMQTCHNLYEYEIEEAKFVSMMNGFKAALCAGNITGIYETKMPLMFKVFTQVGITCKVSSLSSSQNLKISQLERIVGSDTPIIDGSQLQSVFFYEFRRDTRYFIALIAPSVRQGWIFVVNSAKVPIKATGPVWKAVYDKFMREDESILLPEGCDEVELHVRQTTHIADVAKELRNIVKTVKPATALPVIMAVQASTPTEKLLEMLPSLKEFPIVKVHAVEPANIMNVLDWANEMVKRVIQLCFNAFIHLENCWTISNYVGIPICNIPADFLSLALDIFYARTLRNHNHLLWASPSVNPDFGGKEISDLRLYSDWDDVSFSNHYDRVINTETFESRYCVAELDLGAVAVTALIQNVRIIEAEGACEFVAFDNTAPQATGVDKQIVNGLRPTASLTSYDEGAAVSSALKHLRTVFQELIKDIHYNQTELADLLVVHMYRWMCDPRSLMYNPAIATSVNMLMRKLCLLLSAEINRLGGSVVHCSFNKLVVSTGRNDTNQAKLFTASLCDSIANHPIFASLQLTPIHLWNACIWIDPNNYAAIGFHEFTEVTATQQTVAEERVDYTFSMVAELPEQCQKAFFQVVTGYLLTIARYARERAAELASVEDAVENDQLTVYCQDVLSKELSPKLFQITDKLVLHRNALNKEYRKVHDKDANDEFDVPLEFVKALCKVLSPDKALLDSVESLRSQLIQMLRTSAPTSALEWHPPATVIVLENLFCGKCNRCISLDLCAPFQDAKSFFKCPRCDDPIEHTQIEELLIERLSKMVVAYTLQDRRCTKCRQLSVRFLSRHCECSHAYEQIVPKPEFIRSLTALAEVSERLGMKAVSDSIKWQLECQEAC
uniref:DNA polymerase epsilon catalytic subunit n=1 Tax=Panagrellus redivivus TaxID=6233 RepID=A0A7E4VKY8_PANRE